jgi:hypothetical protein
MTLEQSVEAYCARSRAYLAEHPVTGKPRLEPQAEAIKLRLVEAVDELAEVEAVMEGKR